MPPFVKSFEIKPGMDAAGILRSTADGAVTVTRDLRRERFEAEGGLTYRTRAMSSLLGLGFSPEEQEKPVSVLSGGEKAKVQLAKLLLSGANLLLLDEPFSNLDAALRTRMRVELKKLQKDLGLTMVFVTHDQEEAIILSDKMAIMDDGRLVQFDTPQEVYRHPADEYVARFLGLDDIEWGDDGHLRKIIRTK